MKPELLATCANLGAGALLAWLALPLFARISAVRSGHEASSSHRALVWALVLASLFMFVPWARALVSHGRVTAVALPVQAGTARPHLAASSASALGFYFLCAVGVAWSLAVGVASARALTSLAELASLMRRAHQAPPVVMRAVSRCTAPGVERIRRILVSQEASVPFVAVPWAPALVFPAAIHELFDDTALALMIEHEVTHIDRGDLWTSAVVRALCLAFPFHPAAARLANDIAFAREAAVDARVSTRDPHRYAMLLLDVAAKARFDQLPKPVSMGDTALERRIAMLTDESNRRSLSVAPLMLAAALMATASLLAPSVFAARPNALSDAQPRHGTGVFRHTPESSYAACREKSEGDDCPFPTPDGELKGVCTLNADNGRLFCAPPPPPDAPSSSERPQGAHRSSP